MTAAEEEKKKKLYFKEWPSLIVSVSFFLFASNDILNFNFNSTVGYLKQFKKITKKKMSADDI